MKNILYLGLATVLALGGFALVSKWQVADASAESNQVKIYEKDGFRIVESNGIADHEVGQFPNRGNPNRISAQKYKFQIPLNPTISPDGFRQPGPPPQGGNQGENNEQGERRGPPPGGGGPGGGGGPWLFGVGLNGVPMEAGTGEAWNNDMRSGWNNEALTGKLDLGVDKNNAHVQPTGAYHYHGIPTGLVENLVGKDIGKKMVLVGYAADGFPIYSQYGYTKADDATSGLKKLTSSWRLKSGTRPSGPGGAYDGTYHQDFEYAAGLGDLDEFNGRTGVTPEYPNGTYYYILTDAFPFMARQFRGVADKSFQKTGGGGRGPGGGRPGGQRPGGQGGPPNGQRPPF